MRLSLAKDSLEAPQTEHEACLTFAPVAQFFKHVPVIVRLRIGIGHQ